MDVPCDCSNDENTYSLLGITGVLSTALGYKIYRDWKKGCKDEATTSVVIDNHPHTNIDPQAVDILPPIPEGKPFNRRENTHVGSFELRDKRVHIVRMYDDEWFSYRRWRDRKLKKMLRPQADEASQHQTTQPVSLGPGTTQEQNVKFLDTHPGYVLEEKSNFDSVRDHALAEDASLQEFFSRPLKIATIEWQVGGPSIDQKIDPWSLYFENPRVINRVSNYRLMRSKLHVKAVISGNGFHYGRALLCYNPLRLKDSISPNTLGVETDLVGFSQRPNIILDPTNSQGGELVLPFFYYKNLIDITESEWNEMGDLVLQVINPLKHANGATEGVTISLFAWAEEIKFAVPTEKTPATLAPQGDEFTKRPVSYTAGIVSKMAGMMTAIPPIRPFARATEIGADAIGKMATLFGYSRPVILETALYRPVTKQNYAATNLHDDAAKLTVDSKQELTVDPRTVGLDSTDEMAINFIASRESYYCQFPWAVSTVSEQMLWNCTVDPGIWRNFGSEYLLPAAAYASVPFKHWRGSMKFRFQVVASKYHKGRLKIVWDPSGVPGATAEYNTAYTTIVDIADQTDFTVTCGWGQDTSYRQVLPIASRAESAIHNTTPLGIDFSDQSYGNGTLSVYVVNTLTVPNTTINNDIAINVFVSMGDDFEVAQPTHERITRLRLTNPTNLAPQGSDISDAADCIVPQASEVKLACPEEHERLDSHPKAAQEVDVLGQLTDINDRTNHIHFGEAIRSFRQMVKRYNVSEYVAPHSSTTFANYVRIFNRWNMPIDPGYTANAGALTQTLLSGEYVYANMTMLRYATLGYAGFRGSTRWTYDASNLEKHGSIKLQVGLRSTPTGVDNQQLTELTNVNNPADQAKLFNGNDVFSGNNGIAAISDINNPVLNFEVPYYSEDRFIPAKQLHDFAVLQSPYGYTSHAVSIQTPVQELGKFLTISCAAGEDFSTYFFTGAPRLFYEGNWPQS